MRLLLPSILAVLLAAGCVGDIGQEVQQDCGTQGCPKTTQQTGPASIIAIESQQVIPTPPIGSENPFAVSWQVRNAETKQDINNLAIEIYNWGDCTINAVNDYNERLFWTGSDKPTKYSGITEPKISNPAKSSDFDTIVPAFRAGSVRQVKLELTAPKTKLSSSCSIDFRATYNFSALSELDVQTISQAYMRQVGSASYQATERIGPGPIQIRLTSMAALPVKSGYQMPIQLMVQNVGDGLFSSIPVGRMKISVPLDWEATKDSDTQTQVVEPCDSFGDPRPENGRLVMYNRKAIFMIAERGTQSNPLMCYFKMPDVEITKDSTIQASMDYVYEISSKISVDITPVIT